MSDAENGFPGTLREQIEALLFAAEAPRTVRWMAHYLKVPGKRIRKQLDQLRAEYEGRGGALEVREVLMNRGRILSQEEVDAIQGQSAAAEQDDQDPDSLFSALEQREVHGDDAGDLDAPPEISAEFSGDGAPQRALPAYQVAIRTQLKEVVQPLLPPELSRPVLGTLSVIATRQPVLQAELIRVRGKRAYAHIKELLAHRLISRRPVEGTYSIATTSEFTRRYQIDPEVAKRMVKTQRKLGSKAGPEAAAPEASSEVPSDPPVAYLGVGAVDTSAA